TSPVHQQLVQIWEELLEVRPIGISDNFFEAGGHSLLAVRLLDRIEQVFGKKISPSILLANPTVEELANALTQAGDLLASDRYVNGVTGDHESDSPQRVTKKEVSVSSHGAVQAERSKRSSSKSSPLLSSIKALWTRPPSSA